MSGLSGLTGGGGGSAGLVGPNPSVDNAILRSDGTSGGLAQSSDIKIGDSIGSPTAMQLQLRDDSGTPRMEITGGYVFAGGSRFYLGGDTANAKFALRADTSWLTMASGWGLGWTSSSNDAVNTSPDAGLSRSAAARVRVTDGSTGYGSLELASNVIIKAGSGSPEGTVTASVGSLYLRTDGGLLTTLYVKESGTGNTGWVAK